MQLSLGGDRRERSVRHPTHGTPVSGPWEQDLPSARFGRRVPSLDDLLGSAHAQPARAQLVARGHAPVPTEHEKAAACESLAIERLVLLVPACRGAAGNVHRRFSVGVLIAGDVRSTVFVSVDPGHHSATDLRNLGPTHRAHWKASGSSGPESVGGGTGRAHSAMVTLFEVSIRKPASDLVAAQEPENGILREEYL